MVPAGWIVFCVLWLVLCTAMGVLVPGMIGCLIGTVILAAGST